VYDRSKSKGEKAAKAAPKKAPVAAVKAASKKPTLTEGAVLELAKYSGGVAESMFGFQILGANITTLTSAYEAIKGEKELAKLIADEISATVETLRALRIETFAGLSKSVSKETAVETKPELKSVPVVAAPPPPQPVAAPPAPPAMPQGNSSFTPPAPPALPQH